ncbi:MAG TPA: 2-oxoacid:acceptor oxidoreductase subunit alpha [Candidatus Nanoarchaeia archaeon]|nr:2-oxoacid:acceptor oxidoreductase subunit alpha [Candidatus Nanoarchaeia archaeon]
MSAIPLAAESFTIRIGGEAGQGTATTAEILAKIFLRLGYHLFTSKEYASQIQGGHNYHNLRVSTQPVKAETKEINYLLAFNEFTLTKHQEFVAEKGIIFYDQQYSSALKRKKSVNSVSLPWQKLKQGHITLMNAIFVGAIVKALGLDFNLLSEAVQEKFKHKLELQKMFLEAAKTGFGLTSTKIQIKPLSSKFNLAYLTGKDAIVKGALKAGLTFHAQYPMTPVSGILHSLVQEAIKNKNLKVVQPEDEIAVISMALGASYAGARAMIATAGGGFALMVESLGLAGMAEIPLVIIEGQRPGPATGLPTKTEQGDLLFVLNAAPGDFPKVVVAPRNAEECYTETKRAFYLAEKYQLPVIVLVDKHLAESFQSLDLVKEEKEFRFDSTKRINLLPEVKTSDLNPDGLFKRYDNSSRTIPGTKNGMYTCAGDEHDAVGYITEEPEIRIQMMQRRMHKLDLIAKELPQPELVGNKKAKTTLLCWGNNFEAVKEAMERLDSKKLNCLALKYLWPFPTKEVKKLLAASKGLILIENNYSGQLGQLITQKTGIEIKDKILRYDGLPFTVEEIYAELKKRLK